MAPPKRHGRARWRPGDVFVVRNLDGKYTVGQAWAYETRTLHSVACAFFEPRVEHPSRAKDSVLDLAHCFSTLLATPDLLDSGDWKVVDHRPVLLPRKVYPYEKLLKKGWNGVTVTGSGIAESFLDAYQGLAPWDDWHDPHYLDALLLDPSKKPARLVFKQNEGPPG